MKKGINVILGMAVLLGVLTALGGAREATAQVQINVNLGPPPIVAAEPPTMVLVPHSQVYFVPEPDVDIFFYKGYWWSPRGERWYRSRAYKGPWTIVERRYVPGPVYRVPRDYRVVYERERHIPYGQWKKQYKDHWKAEQKALKHHRKAERKEFKAHEKQGKEWNQPNGPGRKEFELHQNDRGRGPGRG
ncbi:hypothetical protein [Syntrophorhabdus aromaticivorans]|uniref:YXWGXW repeat-containing protein n=1 Tax=Syntrophorhabdus aromaticivorans TaxID=328301 RepID=A0A351U5S4_9BACT|nr:hypothetical protein [Syntrophorhabdus aromaticivorans]NLW36199.1 hypothetical protein [Syntrophorhabdus aromaticivorans]HBA55305.1 hypothetical protein [Syntrophorhabdus aromaticivorans]